MAVSAVRAHLEDGTLLRKVIDGSRYVLHELNFEVNDEGFQAEGIDDSRSLFMQLVLNKNGFEDFECGSDMKFGLSVQNLHDVFKCSFLGDSMTFSAEKGGENLFVDFESKREDRESTFSIKLIDQSNFESLGDLGVDLNPDFTVTMNSAVLNRFITTFAQMAKNTIIKFKVEETSLEMEITNVDLIENGSSINHRLCQEPNRGLEISQDGEIPLYSEDFDANALAKICKCTPVSQNVTLYFAQDQPLCIEYGLGDLGYIRYRVTGTIAAENIGTQMSQLISQSQ